ncbi:MAG: FG-GAP-like repeat-containing protein, partial [Thermoguttaceae bacterium]|nr:FG-GAP-like repeat-containing protein [Thermoguttaceae bacterium]
MFGTLRGVAARRRTHRREQANRNSAYHRRISFEPLEDRRMLSMVTLQAGPDLPPMPLEMMEPAGEAATVELISRAHPDLLSETAGVSGTTDWSGQTISADGRYVTFASYAQNLVSGLEIVPGVSNVYRFDRQTSEVLLVSINTDGTGSGNGLSETPTISADGSIVAFRSQASNLHALDTDTGWDIFARDLSTGTTHLVSINTEGTGSGNGPCTELVISADGSVVAFRSQAPNLHALANTAPNIFARDLTTGQTHLVSVNKDGNGAGNAESFHPSISADGSVIAFKSRASNFHEHDTDTEWDVFARNLLTNTTYLVSINKDGNGSGNSVSENAVISADGSTVAFHSTASNLHDKDTNAQWDVFARHLTTGTTHLVSINKDGNGSGNGASQGPAISADGTLVAFKSQASNLHTLDTDTNWDIFARNLTAGTTHLVSVNADGDGSGNGESESPVISADGSVVAFRSQSSNLHALDTDTNWDIFARNLTAGTTHLVSVNTAGDGSGDGASESPVISADGSVVAFRSQSSNLHALDTDTTWDIFARNLNTGTTHLVSVNTDGDGSGNGDSESPVIGTDGTVVAFRSQSSNLHALDTDTNWDIFARNLSTSTTHLVSVNKDGAGSGNGLSESPVISANGSVVAFTSRASNLIDADYNDYGDVFALALDLPTTDVLVLGDDLVITDIAGGDTDDTITLSTDGTSLFVHDPNHVLGTVIPGAEGSGTHTITVPLSAFTGSIIVDSLGGNDVLTIDFSGGNPIPIGGLSYNGGDGEDLLTLLGGGTEAVAYTPDAATLGAGVVVADGTTIAFTGLEPINVVGAGTFALDLPGTDDVVYIATGALAGDLAAGALVFTGTSGGLAFEAAHVRNTTNVIVDTTTVDGDDTITVTGADNAHDNTNLTILTGAGDDTVNVDGGIALPADGTLTIESVTINLPNSASSIAASGAGAVSITAMKSIALAAGSSIATVGGDITLLANQQPAASGGDFVGVDVDGGTIECSGSGTLTIRGRGGDDAGGAQHGVQVRNGGQIIGGDGGEGVVIVGTGGGGAGGGNHGVQVSGTGPLVTSTPILVVPPERTYHEHRNSHAFAALKSDGSVVTWGHSDFGGDSSSVAGELQSGVSQIFSTYWAFAALKDDGSVVTWGYSAYGGDSSSVAGELESGVSQIFSANRAFAALKTDGSVVTWGDSLYGGDSSSVAGELESGVCQIFSTIFAFAALKTDGSVVTWGYSDWGGDSSSVAGALESGVSQIFSTGYAFAALKSDGSVVTWGDSTYGGDSSSVAGALESGVSQIFSAQWAFAALKSDGSVVTWGYSERGGDSSSVAGELESGVCQIFSTWYAFAALKSDGSVVTWGDSMYGGDSSSVAGELGSGVSQVFSTQYAFAALKSDGSVVTWGSSGHGGDSSSVAGELESGVSQIFATELAFAALKSDGSVVTWGHSGYGGDSSGVAGELESGVFQIFTTQFAFAALKSDGSVVTWGYSAYGGDSSSVAGELQSGVVGFANPFTDDWLLSRDARITSRGADVSLTGIAGSGDGSLAVRLTDTGSITTEEHGGDVILVGDSVVIVDATAAVSANGSSRVSIAPYEAGVPIDLGSNTAGSLSLTDEELARITAGTLIIGDSAAGTITVTATITRSAPTHVELYSGDAIIFDPGSLDTAGGNLLLAPGTGGVQPITSGTDIDVGAADVSFAAGAELAIRIDGTTVDSQYSQVNVAGTVDLTGAVLALSGTYTPAVDDTFTIVTSGGMTGTFTGLPEGAVIADFLGSGRHAVITYVGGDGNDVILTVQNQAPVIEHLIVVPDPVARGDQLTLTAEGVSDPDGVVERVEFWLDAVGAGGTLLGEGVQQNGDWSLTVSTAGWDLGGHTVFARAQDNDGAWSNVVSTTLDVSVGTVVYDLMGRITSNGDWWLGESNGVDAFTNSQVNRWNPSFEWADVMVGDFTGSGLDDIAGRIVTSGDWWVAVNNGDGTFTNEKWTRWNPTLELVDVMAADFTGNGKADIAGRVATTGDWWVAESTGNGFTNAKWTRWNPNLELVDVMAADFTGDGVADIAGRIATTGDWWVARSTGSS